jgi:hypothetical protein
MSESNSEKTPGQIATDLINNGYASQEKTKEHEKLHKLPTLPASAIQDYKNIGKVIAIKKKS